MPRTVKVAVVGSGLAGLTAAHLLSTQKTEPDTDGEDLKFEVHLFEKSSSLGMDCYSISVPGAGEKEEWRVDVPMRSFQGGYYTQLIKLYTKIGVSFAERNFSYSFVRMSPNLASPSSSIPSLAPDFIYNGENGVRGVSLPSSLRASASSLLELVKVYLLFAFTTLATIAAYLRLLWLCSPTHRHHDLSTLTLDEWTTRTLPRGILARWTDAPTRWRAFVADVLIPLFSGMCTAPADDIWQHPVEELLDYIWLTLFTPHYVAANGVQEVATKLSASVHQIHLKYAITRLSTDPSNPAHMTLELGNGQVLNGFAHVVFATQANSAARVVQMYKNDMETESIMAAYEAQKMNQALAALDAFKYVRNLVVNHSDMRLLPPVETDRRELNLVSWDLSSSSSVSEKKKTPSEMESDLQVSPAFTMATHILARPDGAEAVYQTTNPTVPIAPSTIRSVARMERAVLTLQSKAARASFIVTDMNGASRLGSTQGVRATPGGPQLWFCGSYAGAGIPLLEGCVVSAQVVVEHGIFRSERVSARTEPW